MSNTKDSDLMGSGEGYTLDADEAKKRIVERRNKLLENPIVSEVKSGGSGKKEYSVSDEYSVKEGKSRTEAGEDNSGTEKSPLQ